VNQLTDRPVAASCEGDLRRFVASNLRQQGGFATCVARISRKLGDYHSSFAIEDLDVEFDDGTRLSLVFKNLSPNALLEYARQIRPHFSYDPRREVDVYREILAGTGLGTATCFGAVADPSCERYWLLLEKVPGVPLAKTGDFTIWCDVARWLAHMHCALDEVARDDKRLGSLLKYNEGSYSIWIERAEQFCKLRSSADSNGMPNPIQPVADQCRLAVRKIGCLPHTFIHGEFYASNVLIGQAAGNRRICPIDWETAAIGPALLDLAALVAGNWPEELRTEMAMAYYETLPPAFNVYGNTESFFRVLHCCRLFMAIKWLGWSSDWQAPDEHCCDWLAEATALAPIIDSL
jgi:hypothetical protein